MDFFVFGAVFLAETLLAVFFEDFFFEAGFVFFLAGFFGERHSNYPLVK